MTRRIRCRIVAGALALTAVIAAAACEDSGTGDDDVSIAFLRAVAGTPSTEPAFLAELSAAGYSRR